MTDEEQRGRAMPEYPTDDLITEQELCSATGIDRYCLRRLRRWLGLEVFRTFRGRPGSETRYRSIAAPMIRRFRELQQKTRKVDECLWGVWLDGSPFDIAKWADARLSRFETALSSIDNVEALRKRLKNKLLEVPSRTDPRRPINSRLSPEKQTSLLMWAVTVAAGIMPSKSLYDPSSPVFDALRESGSFSKCTEPPDHELEVESFSITWLRGILRQAKTEEIEQARRDWRAIARLFEMSRAIDWRAVRKALKVQSTSSAQPPAPADFFRAVWQDFDTRAVLLPFLISVRRLPEQSRKLSEILAVSEWALMQFPRRAPVRGHAAKSRTAEVPQKAPTQGTGLSP
jgi:hypothetical protein